MPHTRYRLQYTKSQSEVEDQVISAHLSKNQEMLQYVANAPEGPL